MKKKQNCISYTMITSFFLFFLLIGATYASDTSKAPPRYLPQKHEKTLFQVLSEEGTPDILLIQTANPWDSDADTTVLDLLGYSYKMADMEEIANIEINNYQVVLIVNDQVQSFYDSYSDNYHKFEDYVRNGGILVFFACDHGWADGNNYTNLPGGVEVGDNYNDTNIISNFNHPIVTRVLTNNSDDPLIDSDLEGNYCSHNYFVESTLPSGSDIVLRTNDSNRYPTLAVYTIGTGSVIASGLTWEAAYSWYPGDGQFWRFGRVLQDVFKYAFSIAGGHKTAGIKVDIYPEDYFAAERKEVYKAKEDLLDIVACITNNTNPNEEQTDVSLKLTIDNTKIDTSFLKVYQRASAEEIAVTAPVELTDYTVAENDGLMEITLNGLTIPKESDQQWNDFVFRFKIADDVGNGQTLDAEATVSGNDIETSSEKLSDGKATVTVISKGKIVLTNRELMYKQFAQNSGTLNKDGAFQVNQLWDSLYSIAADQRAVVYHIDKYDRDDDGDENNNITIDWFVDRQHLANGESDGHYHYDSTPTTNNEEASINQVATKVKGLLKDFITHSMRVNIYGLMIPFTSVDVVILGGDAIIPFYRVFDPSKNVIDSKQHHGSNYSVTRIDANNNYMFTDIFYRDFSGDDWDKGDVENIFVGRITGTTADNMKKLLESSNMTTSASKYVVKLENNMRDCELTDYTTQAEDKGYTITTDIDGINIDVANPEGCMPWTKKPQCYGTDDKAEWSDFEKLFTGTNVNDFDMMRIMAHGDISGVYDSEESGTNYDDDYFTGLDIWLKGSDIADHFSKFKPFFVFDACLVGIVDGTSIYNLLNAMLPVGVRGIIGASAVTSTPKISDYNDLITKNIFNSDSIGKALTTANKKFNNSIFDSDSIIPLCRYQMNLFGLPWAAITPPDDRAANKAIQEYNEKNESSTIHAIILGTNTKTTVVDASSYSQTTSSLYDIVTIDGFEMLRENSATPVVPKGRFSVNVPLNATIDSVTVDFSSPVDLGSLNIPAFQPPPPMPDPDGLMPSGGYVDSPTDLGVFPAEQYSYKSAEIIGYKQVLVDIFPLTFDTGSGQTTLYSSATINVTYTTPDQGLVQSFTSDKRIYAVEENIYTTSTIENISSSAHSFTVTVDVLDLTDKIIATDSASQSIDRNTVGLLAVDLTAPATAGSYRLRMTASDGTNTIGDSQQEIDIVEGQIASIVTPATIDAGSYGSFTIEFTNFSTAEITAYEDIYIYASSGEQVAHLPQVIAVIETGEAKATTSQWFPPASVTPGTYYAYVTVKVNDNVYTMKSDQFDIIGQNDILLPQGWNLISLNLIPQDAAIDTVLSEISGKYSSVWAYVNGSWQVYDMFNPGFSDLSTITSGYGYWIYMANNGGVLPVDGAFPASDLSIGSGWNLVGFNSSSSMSITDALASIAGKFISVWAYVDGSWKVYYPADPGQSDLTTMEPGYGYWINATEPCKWTLP